MWAGCFRCNACIDKKVTERNCDVATLYAYLESPRETFYYKLYGVFQCCSPHFHPRTYIRIRYSTMIGPSYSYNPHLDIIPTQSLPHLAKSHDRPLQATFWTTLAAFGIRFASNHLQSRIFNCLLYQPSYRQQWASTYSNVQDR